MNLKLEKERFDKFVYPEPNTGCWLWGGAINSSGYGNFTIEGKTRSAHKVSWERENGPVPQNLCIDHLCRVRCCVNPEHMEIVSNLENILRGRAIELNRIRAKQRSLSSHCKYGHPFIPENTYYIQRETPRRVCKTCHNRRRNQSIKNKEGKS